ncbi:MAG: glycosyltransferase [Bacteroidales bacterium]
MPAGELTVIVPVYNEQDSLFRFKQEMDKFIDQSSIPVKVLFVDDGSEDSSLKHIQSICADHEKYGYISFQQNQGLSTAIKAGVDQAEGKWIGYIDADLQTSPSDFLLFLPYIEEYDLVIGHRHLRKDPPVKKISSLIANAFRRAILKDGVRDTGCPLKIMKTTTAKQIPFFNGMHRFIPALVQTTGGSVREVPVQHFKRTEGSSKYKLLNRLIHPFLDTLAVYWIKKRTIRYRMRETTVKR